MARTDATANVYVQRDHQKFSGFCFRDLPDARDLGHLQFININSLAIVVRKIS